MLLVHILIMYWLNIIYKVENMKCFIYLIVGIIGISFEACSQQQKTVSVSYCSSFVKDTSVALSALPLSVDMGYIIGMNYLKGNVILQSGDRGMESKFQVFCLPNMELEAQIKEDERLTHLSYGKNCLLSYDLDSLYRVDWVNHGLQIQGVSAVPRLPLMSMVSQLDDNVFLFNKPITQGKLHEIYCYDVQTGAISSFGIFPEDNSRFKTMNRYQEAYRHALCVKPDGSKILEYYLFLRRIRIYNNEGSLQNDVSIDYEPFEYVVHSSMCRYFYIGGAWATNQHIYLLCTDRDMNASCPETCSLVVLDWEGNLLTRYRMDHYITSFIIDEKENVFYGCGPSNSHAVFTFLLSNNDMKMKK